MILKKIKKPENGVFSGFLVDFDPSMAEKEELES